MQIYKSVIMSNILLLDSAIMEQILRSSTTFPGITRIHKQWISCLDPSISRNIQWTLLTRPVLSCNQQTFCSLWPVSELYAMVRSCQSEGFINRTPFVNDLVPIVESTFLSTPVITDDWVILVYPTRIYACHQAEWIPDEVELNAFGFLVDLTTVYFG